MAPGEALLRKKLKAKAASPVATPPAKPKVRGPKHELVEVSAKSQYCQVCYAHWAAHPQLDWTTAELKRQCDSSKWGCEPCRKRICTKCAETYDHRTKATARDEWAVKLLKKRK